MREWSCSILFRNKKIGMTHFYITTTLPYANAAPHLGHALEFVQGDVRSRFERLRGKEVYFNVGLDEHGTKVYQCAKKEGVAPKEFVDTIAKSFQELVTNLKIQPTRFIRTTDADHYRAVEELWNRCKERGDIYTKEHKGDYCVGCELFLSDTDLVADKDGTRQCPLHPGKKLEYIAEENYFFKLSKYQEQLLSAYRETENFVIPKHRLNELCSFVESGLEDVSISRCKKRLPWGVPVPGDASQTVYVWFDALTNYLTTIGWPDDPHWEKWWPVVQIAGKDNLRQQCVIWQAMLLSLGIHPSKTVYIHGFLTSQGRKMSKTVGNVIHPNDLLKRYGAEFTRLYLTKHVHSYEDTDISFEHIQKAYEADAVNELGNLVSRIMKMAEEHLDGQTDEMYTNTFDAEYCQALERFDYREAIGYVWREVQKVNKRITTREPFKLIKKDPQAGKEEIRQLLKILSHIGYHLKPFMPETAVCIEKAIRDNRKPDSLFPSLR